ncbi:hypothetical protein HHE014_00630 [Helicobacter heilmannii]|nr:hypothetical protein HHE014_00630 [Helicobacter heilmannii]
MVNFLSKITLLFFGFLGIFGANGCLQPEHCQLIWDAVKHVMKHICK